MYACRILADSVAPNGKRLTTMEVTYPRFVHSEFMTHRVFSRNAASNRAIPVSKLLHAVESTPVIPLSWGKNQKGMQMGEEFPLEQIGELNRLWLRARKYNLAVAKRLMDAGVHKSLPNRLLEPWQWITVIVSSTEWINFFNLRTDAAAEQHIRKIASMMYREWLDSEPAGLQMGEWHLPLVGTFDRQEFDIPDLKRLSVGRCARVSYLTHNGTREPTEDFRLHDDLIRNGHWSPFEHQATPIREIWADGESGNYRGWRQYRKQFPNENRDMLELLSE